MFSPLRNRFGIPGVISVIALVFAMLGGAYAANDSSSGDATASAKRKSKGGKRGPRGPRGKRGKAGPAGPQGPAGAQGPAGPQGPPGANGNPGANGTNGADGKSVALTQIAEGEVGCESLGGVEVEVEGSGSAEEVCNGAEGPQGPQGDPWTAGGTLPKGETLTGAWALSGVFVTIKDGDGNMVPIITGNVASVSLSIPLAQTIPSSKFIYTATAKATCEAKAEPEKATCLAELSQNCPGTVAIPAAAEGYACVYQQSLTSNAKYASFLSGMYSVAGGQLTFLPTAFNSTGEGEIFGNGSYAVTSS